MLCSCPRAAPGTPHKRLRLPEVSLVAFRSWSSWVDVRKGKSPFLGTSSKPMDHLYHSKRLVITYITCGWSYIRYIRYTYITCYYQRVVSNSSDELPNKQNLCQVARMILERHNWFTQVENMPLLNLCSKSAIVGCWPRNQPIRCAGRWEQMGTGNHIETVKVKTDSPLPSGKLTKSYWKWPFIVDLPMKNGDFT
jgi:hypothetical protein